MRHGLDHILAYSYYVGCAVDDQTRSPSVEIRDDDSVVRVRGRGASAKPLSEVEHRHKVSSEIHYAFHVILGLGHWGDFSHQHDLLSEHDVDGEFFGSYSEDH